MQYIPNNYLNNDPTQPTSQQALSVETDFATTFPASFNDNYFHETATTESFRRHHHSSNSSSDTALEHLYKSPSQQAQLLSYHPSPASASSTGFSQGSCAPTSGSFLGITQPQHTHHLPFAGSPAQAALIADNRPASFFMSKSNNARTDDHSKQQRTSEAASLPKASGHKRYNSTGGIPSPSKMTSEPSTRTHSHTSKNLHYLPTVKVLSVDPLLGVGGSNVKVVINVQPSQNAPIRSFRVTFGTVDATTRVAFENRASEIEHVELVATAPRLAGPIQTGRVSLLVQAVDAQEQVLATAEAGAFEYVDAASFGYTPSLVSQAGQSGARKRHGSPLTNGRQSRMRTNLTINERYSDSPNPSFSLGDTPMSTTATHFGSPQQPGSTMTDRGMFMSPNLSHNDSNRRQMNVSTASQWSLTAEAPSQSASQPMQDDVEGDNDAGDAAGGAPSSSSLRHPPIPSASEAENQPVLLRTSQIPAEYARNVTADGRPAITKAQLRFDGDLNTMAMGWSADEWAARRRLVQFWRSQDHNILNASFKPIRLHEYRPNAIVVSCIFRDDKNECFVTSVDAIYLLEALIGVRFTVEEKNRIRRNLEGFKPITISKSKPESEPFFKLIMGFPSPKPRNIEKDVKVFPWKIVANALKKIILKYSAMHDAPADVIAAQNLNVSTAHDVAMMSRDVSPNARIPDEPITPISATPGSATPFDLGISMSQGSTSSGKPAHSAALADQSHSRYDFTSLLAPPSFSDRSIDGGSNFGEASSEYSLSFPQRPSQNRPHHPGHARSFSDLSDLQSMRLPDQPVSQSQHQRSRSSINLSWSQMETAQSPEVNRLPQSTSSGLSGATYMTLAA